MAGAPKTPGREKRCGVCGHESLQPGFRPPLPEQAPDLDLRPGEPVRSTMARWLQACPHCGYAAPDITEAHPAGAEAVAAAPYRALIADIAHPVLARRFLAWAHVLEETGALHAAAEATLHAAWVADDLNREDLARQWRREAVALWRSGPALDAEQSVRVIDALRRAGDFAEAEAAAEALMAGNPPESVAQVTALEARLIAAEDTGRHSIASAIAPPARRPHVTHQQSPGAKKRPPEGGGLKSWLRRIFKG